MVPPATPEIARGDVYRSPGRFAGWPANYGFWRWGDELLAIFVVGFLGADGSIHARDTSRPFAPVQARSTDNGRTWSIEPFTGRIPGGSLTLNGDEHVTGPLKAATHLVETDFERLEEPLDFTDPETIVLCGRTDLERGSRSWFYASGDRARTWRGPYALPSFGLLGTSARTDVIPLGPHSALFLLSGSKPDGGEGRAFAARTDDGGRSFHLTSMIGPAPTGFSIMPSSVRLDDGVILTALRWFDDDGENRLHHIDLYRSRDEGAHWDYVATPVANTGGHGNPPALVRTSSGVLVIHYGYRDAPQGLRAVTSTDHGATWSEPIALTDDSGSLDMGYPRSVALADGEVLTLFYTSRTADGERAIESVRWRPR